jgi:triphosphoribosyl-dephospho-CoA synthase
VTPGTIAALAVQALLSEIDTAPKPGLVSPIDDGSHADMNAALLRRSAEALRSHFARLAQAGAMRSGVDTLRRIGVAAEEAMLIVTHGVNTHRGAIFGLGLLCAAAGMSATDTGRPRSLGDIVRECWGVRIALAPAQDDRSHGATVQRRYGAGGARAQAASGFTHVYQIGWPALTRGRQLAGGDENAARVQCCFALMSTLTDTNLLHRGGLGGLLFVRERAKAFLTNGGVGNTHWRTQALSIHRELVLRRLSPGGCADLLAMTLFVDAYQLATQVRTQRQQQRRGAVPA